MAEGEGDLLGGSGEEAAVDLVEASLPARTGSQHPDRASAAGQGQQHGSPELQFPCGILFQAWVVRDVVEEDRLPRGEHQTSEGLLDDEALEADWQRLGETEPTDELERISVRRNQPDSRRIELEMLPHRRRDLFGQRDGRLVGGGGLGDPAQESKVAHATGDRLLLARPQALHDGNHLEQGDRHRQKDPCGYQEQGAPANRPDNRVGPVQNGDQPEGGTQEAFGEEGRLAERSPGHQDRREHAGRSLDDRNQCVGERLLTEKLES